MIYVIWEFHVKPEKQTEFETYYSANGKWAELFRKSPAYRETTLVRDVETSTRYLLTDIWENLDSYRDFKKDFAEAYHQLDKKCEEFTEKETCLGIFEDL